MKSFKINKSLFSGSTYIINASGKANIIVYPIRRGKKDF